MNKVSIEQAVDMLCALPRRMPAETAPLLCAQGRVLAGDVYAAVSVPPFDRSPYDGYAFRGEDTAGASRENPVTLRIVEELPAGKAPTVKLGPGEAVKILTGAPVPEGADAIVKYEETEFTAETVKIFSPVPPHTDIVPAGEDVEKGSLLLRRGSVLTPAAAGLLAGQGMAEVSVFRRPRACVFSTGSELLEAGEPPAPGKIYNSNTTTICAYLENLGCECIPAPSVPDDPERIAQCITAALGDCDLVVTTGGASVGDYDFAVRAAELTGARLLFWKIAMKPGGSVVAAEKDGKLILNLSGNPGAAVTTLLRVGAPYIKRLCGREDYLPETMTLCVKEDFKKKNPQTRIVRGRLSLEDGQAYFVPQEGQGNGMVSSFVGCDLLAELPAGSPPPKAGELIRVFRV